MGTKNPLLALALTSLLLTSCISKTQGIFGSLPDLYESVASLRRDLDASIDSGAFDDKDAAKAMKEFNSKLEDMMLQIQSEAKLLKGVQIPISVTEESGYNTPKAFIETVIPGFTTIVSIRIPAEAGPKRLSDKKAFVCFLDEDSLPVAKALAWYDAKQKSILLDVPFSLLDGESAPPKGAFDHYGQVTAIRLVGEKEYYSDNSEKQEGTLLTLEQPRVEISDSTSHDTSSINAPVDSIANKEEKDNAWEGPVLTPKGVGVIRLGASLVDLPGHVNGLYEHKVLEKQYDEMEEEPMLTATFRNGGKTIISALGDEQGNIVFITIETSDIKVEIDGHVIGVGDPVSQLLKIKGVKPDESGAFAATYHGISFTPTPTGKIHSISVGAVW